MPFGTLVSIVTVLIAAESAAFGVLPAKTAGITRLTCSGRHVGDRRALLHMMMGKKGGGGSKAKQKKKRGSAVGEDVEKEVNRGEAAAGDEGGDVPSLVVMDLDYTLWKPELYQMRGAPFTKKKDGKVRDRAGEVIDLFPGVREVLLEVHRDERFRHTRLAIASRTSHTRWAREVMGLIELEPGLLMRSVFSFSEIYSGSKVKHFGEIRRNSRVPYEEMIFFDDWDQNCKDVGKLGVTCIECRRGLSREVWKRGLASFAAAKESLRP
ncbi:unnamed protein product [Scytosiphon promiscuus]